MFDQGPEESERAREIHEELLRVTGEGLLSGDFEMYFKCFDLPFQLHGQDSVRMIDSEDRARTMYDEVRNRIRHLNVTKYYRRCIHAGFVDDQTVAAAHQTRMMSKAVLVGGAVPAISIIRFKAGEWRVSDQHYARNDRPGFNMSRYLTQDVVPGDWVRLKLREVVTSLRVPSTVSSLISASAPGAAQNR